MTAFWSENIHILFDKNLLLDFWPTIDQSREERMNAISRFIIYSCLFMY